MAGTNLRSTLPITAIDQHSAGGKLLQRAVQEKLKEYMGADYDDEVCWPYKHAVCYRVQRCMDDHSTMEAGEAARL